MRDKRYCYGGQERATWAFQCTHLAQKYLDRGLRAQALEVLTQAARDRPYCIDHWLRLAAAFLAISAPAKAKAALAQAQGLNHDHPSIASLMSMVDLTKWEPTRLDEVLSPHVAHPEDMSEVQIGR